MGKRGGRIAANDYGATESRVRFAVLTIARRLGRHVAHAPFERTNPANGNTPDREVGDRQE